MIIIYHDEAGATQHKPGWEILAAYFTGQCARKQQSGMHL